MQLKDIKTINEVAIENNVNRQTLLSRIDTLDLEEGVEIKKLGRRMPILLSPEGVKKILKIK